MDKRVSRLQTPEDCDQFILNVEQRSPALVQEARRRKVELLAARYGARGAAEEEALRAVYAYEEVLSRKRGRKTHASRTWQMIQRHGIIEAVERAVNRKKETVGYTALVEVGMQDFTFEAVIVRYPHLFRPQTVARAKARVAQWART
jgi:hypothetical protein